MKYDTYSLPGFAVISAVEVTYSSLDNKFEIPERDIGIVHFEEAEYRGYSGPHCVYMWLSAHGGGIPSK